MKWASAAAHRNLENDKHAKWRHLPQAYGGISCISVQKNKKQYGLW